MLDSAFKFLIDVFFGLFTYALLLRFVMQLLRAPFRNPVGQFVTALTDWVVRPARRVIPGLFGVDLASMAKDEVKAAIIRAIHAANERGKELGEELGKE